MYWLLWIECDYSWKPLFQYLLQQANNLFKQYDSHLSAGSENCGRDQCKYRPFTIQEDTNKSISWDPVYGDQVNALLAIGKFICIEIIRPSGFIELLEWLNE